MTVSIKTMQKIIDSKNTFAREALASRPSLPEEIYVQLVKDKSVVVREALSYNEFAPASILRKLSASKAKTVVIGLASNPSTPADIIENIFNKAQENIYILNGMAHNSALSPELFKKLAETKFNDVKYSLLVNPSTPVEILQDLGGKLRNAHWVMADRRLSNPPEIWAELINHEKETVRSLAVEKLSHPDNAEELYATAEYLLGPDLHVRSLPTNWVIKLLENYS